LERQIYLFIKEEEEINLVYEMEQRKLVKE